ncbi:protein LAZ1 homolog 1-like [Gossypium raimondii]|uniref:protein LAZ1 homolog 1-like n=1 Tax=Gossypium raimondii TaxID=29730 RepID=UPI00227AA478|nr:protein LAZ1 homolog 1-like [Gossypium raimondii]XP_052486305.1 protein LAZ1 homolog 1-like [Gossypium raimondii]
MRRLGRANSKTPLLGHSCEKGTIKHSFPMKYVLKPWKLGRWFYQVVKFSIVQYMIIKILAALLAVILEAFELIAMAGYLNKYGLISWFSQTVVKVVGGLGLSWQMSFGILVLLYFYCITSLPVELLILVPCLQPSCLWLLLWALHRIREPLFYHSSPT